MVLLCKYGVTVYSLYTQKIFTQLEFHPHVTLESAFSRFHFFTKYLDDVNVAESIGTLLGAIHLKCAFQKGHNKNKCGRSSICTSTLSY